MARSPKSFVAKPAPTSPRNPAWWWSGLLLLGVALVYANSLRAPFLFDDVGSVVDNPTIHQLSWTALTTPKNETVTGRPLINLSLAINYAISGPTVAGYRATNIALHGLASLVLLGVVRRTLRSTRLINRFSRDADVLAWLIALLWALHPLNTETVVLIAQRAELLCALFYLLTLYGFLRGAQPTPASRRWLIASVAACACGMASKEVMATAPLMVLLLDRTFVAGTFTAGWKQRRLYYVALASTWLLLAAVALRARSGSAGLGLGVTPWQYLLKQAEALVLYLKLSIWPHPLVLDYGSALPASWSEVWWQGTLVFGLFLATVWALVRHPMLGFLGASFFLILAPSSSIIPVVTQTMAEHRMYLPLAVILAYVAAAGYILIGSRAQWVVIGATAGFAILTPLRNRDYRDVVTIWKDTVEKCPQNARAHNNLALELVRLGRVAEAQAHFAQAIELQPTYASPHYNWGVSLLAQQQLDEAITHLEQTLRLDPKHLDAQLNLGNALMQKSRFAEAVVHYQAVLRIQPTAIDATYNLGLALASLGRNREAAVYLKQALQERSDLPEAHYRLARLAEVEGDRTEAERRYREALHYAPKHALASGSLGALLARQGRLEEATQHLLVAVTAQPSAIEAVVNLGNVLLLQGRPKEAIRYYEQALRLAPDDARVLSNLALAREAAAASP